MSGSYGSDEGSRAVSFRRRDRGRGGRIMKRMHVSIVDYFKAPRVVLAIAAIPEQVSGVHLHISVLDNSCSSANFQVLMDRVNRKDVTLIQAQRNTGYVTGINLSVDWSADYIVLLNPDVILAEADVLGETARFLDRNVDVGIVGIRQVDDDGSLTEVARKFPTFFSQIKRRVRFADEEGALRPFVGLSEEGDEAASVDWLQSSFWMVRGSVWRALGGLDERFFLFMADPDFCRRALKVGYRTVILRGYHGRADGIRASAGGVFSVLTRRTLRIHIIDMLRYYWR